MLNAAPGLHCHKPEGAFYVFPERAWLHRQDHRRRRARSPTTRLRVALLDEQGVAAVHGAAFMYPGHFRISYATDTESLREACARIATFCGAMR